MDPLHVAFRQALRFALELHTGQARKGTSIPYIVHPVAVAETLAYHYPENLELVVAGLLHDAVEDTSATLEQIERRFGPTVTTLVDVVTKPRIPADAIDDPVVRWQLERDAQLARLAGASDDAHRLKAADIHANLRSLARDLRRSRHADEVWARFKGSETQTLAHYRIAIEMIGSRLAGAADRRLVAEVECAAAAVGA